VDIVDCKDKKVSTEMYFECLLDKLGQVFNLMDYIRLWIQIQSRNRNRKGKTKIDTSRSRRMKYILGLWRIKKEILWFRIDLKKISRY